MAKVSSKHVVPTASGGWAVKSAGASRALKSFDAQADALAFARTLAEDAQTELYVHGRDGSIVDKQSFDLRPRIHIALRAADDTLIAQGADEVADAARRTGALVEAPQSQSSLDSTQSRRGRTSARTGMSRPQHLRLMDIVNPSDKTVDVLKKLQLPAGLRIEIKKRPA